MKEVQAMSDIEKLGIIEGHVSAVFNAREVACIGSHLNTVCNTVNQLIDEIIKLRREVNELKTEIKESTNVVD